MWPESENEATARHKREMAAAKKNHAARKQRQELKTHKQLMRHMNEEALAAMKRSAIESLTAQLLGIAELKQNREIAAQEQNERAKLHNVSLFMGQLAAIAERQTKTPDWGEW